MQALVSRPTPPGPIFGVPLSLYREREEEERRGEIFDEEEEKVDEGMEEGSRGNCREKKIERRDNANDYLWFSISGRLPALKFRGNKETTIFGSMASWKYELGIELNRELTFIRGYYSWSALRVISSYLQVQLSCSYSMLPSKFIINFNYQVSVEFRNLISPNEIRIYLYPWLN